MKKRIIALILSVVIILGLLPAQAIAASFANTTEGKKSARKAEVASSLEGTRQSIMDYLDSAMAEFTAPANYSAEVWSLAQNLYKAEAERISKMTSFAQLLDLENLGLFDYSPNETTVRVSSELLALSYLDLSYYKSQDDIEALKDDLREQLNKVLADYDKNNFTDFYWDRIVASKDDFNAKINAIKTCPDYVDYVILWGNSEIFYSGYDDYDDDDENANAFNDEGLIYILKYQYIVSKAELTAAIYGIEDVLEEYITDYLPSRGYKGDTDRLYSIIDRFETNALKATFAKQIIDYADSAYSQMISITGKDPTADYNKEPANRSDKIRLINKLYAYFIATYSSRNYSEDGWDEMLNIYDKYEQKVNNINYKDDLNASKIYSDFVKQLKTVQTYAEELKELKADFIDELKHEYLGNPRYNQSKVKPIITEAIKKINASKKLEQVETYYKAYCKKADATINKYKIVTSKSGAGAVSASKTVNYGSSYTVKIVPSAGYKIKTITVDGRKVKLVNAYTFKAIKKSHTIKVTFGK